MINRIIYKGDVKIKILPEVKCRIRTIKGINIIDVLTPGNEAVDLKGGDGDYFIKLFYDNMDISTIRCQSNGHYVYVSYSSYTIVDHYEVKGRLDADDRKNIVRALNYFKRIIDRDLK